jgi:hypothetical protein
MHGPHGPAFVAKTRLKTDGLESSRSTLRSEFARSHLVAAPQMAF